MFPTLSCYERGPEATEHLEIIQNELDDQFVFGGSLDEIEKPLARVWLGIYLKITRKQKSERLSSAKKYIKEFNACD